MNYKNEDIVVVDGVISSYFAIKHFYQYECLRIATYEEVDHWIKINGK